jgi:hypothetical protein
MRGIKIVGSENISFTGIDFENADGDVPGIEAEDSEVYVTCGDFRNPGGAIMATRSKIRGRFLTLDGKLIE